MAFSITYETVTPESAEHGDADERGWIVEPNDAYSFSDCYSTLRSAGAIGTYCEADEYPLRAPRTLTFYRLMKTIGRAPKLAGRCIYRPM